MHTPTILATSVMPIGQFEPWELTCQQIGAMEQLSNIKWLSEQLKIVMQRTSFSILIIRIIFTTGKILILFSFDFFCFFGFSIFLNLLISDWDLNLATHIEERLYTFGGPFAMFDDFTDKERDLSVTMMEQWGKFIKQQTVDWGQHPHHAYIDLNGLTEIEQEAHSHRL